MPTHKINIRTTKNGLWTINGADPDILHAFVRFYNTIYTDSPKQKDATLNKTNSSTFSRSIIIDNQTGRIIRDPFE